jgi:hypothetical protein
LPDSFQKANRNKTNEDENQLSTKAYIASLKNLNEGQTNRAEKFQQQAAGPKF